MGRLSILAAPPVEFEASKTPVFPKDYVGGIVFLFSTPLPLFLPFLEADLPL